MASLSGTLQGMKYIALLLILSLSFFSHAGDLKSPVGRWKTIDDNSGKPKSIVEISETKGELSGKVIEVFPQPGKEPNPKCDKCKDERKDKPVVGMTIFSGLKRHDEKWSGGEILDPENGKTYRCNLHLKDDGKKLVVRGYIGISWIGRSQTWERQPTEK